MEEFDCSLFSSDSEGFYFYVPSRFMWNEFVEIVQKHIDDFQYVPVDDWKLSQASSDEIIYRKM